MADDVPSTWDPNLSGGIAPDRDQAAQSPQSGINAIRIPDPEIGELAIQAHDNVVSRSRIVSRSVQRIVSTPLEVAERRIGPRGLRPAANSSWSVDTIFSAFTTSKATYHATSASSSELTQSIGGQDGLPISIPRPTLVRACRAPLTLTRAWATRARGSVTLPSASNVERQILLRSSQIASAARLANCARKAEAAILSGA